MRRSLALLTAVAALLAGCGTQATSPRARNATLVLDFTPNAIHTGIYAAIARGYLKATGVSLHVVAPSSSTDPIKLLVTGRTDFAILDIHDLAIARERGADIVGVMAVVERPLAAVIAQPADSNPRQLVGQTVGVTGAPSDTAVLDSIVSGAGGAPSKLHTVTIGFNAVAALLSRRVAGATAFWNDEGVTLQHDRPGFHVFRVEQYGAPAYPELVLCVARTVLNREPHLVRGVVGALVRGYRATEADPKLAAAELEKLVPGLDPHLVAEQLSAELPAFPSPQGGIGVLDPATLRAWASWEARFGIVKQVPEVGRTFDADFLPPQN